MAKVVITPKKLKGEIAAISSKSYAHRIFIAASLSAKETNVVCTDMSDDIKTTVSCLKSIKCGTKIECRESGSTLRFLLPLAAAMLNKTNSFEFSGSGNLPERPIFDLINVLSEKSVRFSSSKLPFFITGKLDNGDFRLPGNVSSQYISGLLMALPLLNGDSKIIVDGLDALQSKSYIEITKDTLKKFGVFSEQKEYGYFIKGGQVYTSPGEVIVEGDWSNAAFFIAANKLGCDVNVSGLNYNSKQGDKKITDILNQIGNSIDISDTPDLFPVLAVVASVYEGVTEFLSTDRLKLKESDRIESVKAMLIGLGFNTNMFKVYDDRIVIIGDSLSGGTVYSFNDHRIVMAAAIAACVCEDPVTIRGGEAVRKSYPRFFNDYKKLGGDVVVDF
ncbi:MAG: 3-phosphoshikimate 1-carboxyvinyltransferase [Eubacterium sp.]|jgi:3-phosphoshikimate 1-carboxyvinyltransferase|nr:3-phosphoshikimate 1-carboxyvinyltransferase [Eubacterium sp.]